jgi:hypothetical protein
MTPYGIQTVFNPDLPAAMPVAEVVVKDSGIDTDFEDSRKNLIQMMATTQGAIQALSALAFQSQMPDAYDVLNKFIKTYNEQQEQLIRFYRIKAAKEVQTQANTTPSMTTVTGETVDNRVQNVFVGTPTDLARVLDNMKKDAGE